MKICPVCKISIARKSKQWVRQIYCSTKCRKVSHRAKKSHALRIERKRANLRQNDEIVYLIRECRRAATVQILHGHDLGSFIETMELIRNRPKGDISLCHIAPVRGAKAIGLFHCQNLFYGGTFQNNCFGNRYFAGGLSLNKKYLVRQWEVTDETTNNEILLMIEEYLKDIIPEYLRVARVRKSAKVSLINKIIEVDKSQSFDELIHYSHKKLQQAWSVLSSQNVRVWWKGEESKYIVYMDSITRFIKYGGERAATLAQLRDVMVVAYMALERVLPSRTYNKYFYVKYEPLINKKFGQVMLKDPASWSGFKDLIYITAFDALQGKNLDVIKFKKTVMKYLKFPSKAWQCRDEFYEDTFS